VISCVALSVLCNMFLGLWCAGVELRGSGRQQGEGQVRTCSADGLEVVKDGREALIDGPGGRGSAVVADTWGH
jgi:hypothetical protein